MVSILDKRKRNRYEEELAAEAERLHKRLMTMQADPSAVALSTEVIGLKRDVSSIKDHAVKPVKAGSPRLADISGSTGLHSAIVLSHIFLNYLQALNVFNRILLWVLGVQKKKALITQAYLKLQKVHLDICGKLDARLAYDGALAACEDWYESSKTPDELFDKHFATLEQWADLLPEPQCSLYQARILQQKADLYAEYAKHQSQARSPWDKAREIALANIRVSHQVASNIAIVNEIDQRIAAAKATVAEVQQAYKAKLAEIDAMPNSQAKRYAQTRLSLDAKQVDIRDLEAQGITAYEVFAEEVAQLQRLASQGDALANFDLAVLMSNSNNFMVDESMQAQAFAYLDRAIHLGYEYAYVIKAECALKLVIAQNLSYQPYLVDVRHALRYAIKNKDYRAEELREDISNRFLEMIKIMVSKDENRNFVDKPTACLLASVFSLNVTDRDFSKQLCARIAELYKQPVDTHVFYSLLHACLDSWVEQGKMNPFDVVHFKRSIEFFSILQDELKAKSLCKQLHEVGSSIKPTPTAIVSKSAHEQQLLQRFSQHKALRQQQMDAQIRERSQQKNDKYSVLRAQRIERGTCRPTVDLPITPVIPPGPGMVASC